MTNDNYIGGSNRASKLRTAIYERRVLADTTPGTLRNKTLTSALYKWHYDNGLFDSIKFLWAGEAGIRLDASAVKRVTKAYSFDQYNQIIPRRNLLTYTEEFDNAGYSYVNVSVSPNLINSPIGYQNADKIVESSANGAHGFNCTQVASINAGTTYTASIYAKMDGRRFMFLAMNYSNFISGNGVCFDLQNGVISGYGTGSSSAGAISNVGNGWYRCSITLTATSSGTNLSALPAPYLLLNSGNAITSYQGDGTSGIYIWGAQLEIGSTPTAYQRVIDANSWDGLTADASQGTFTNQPYISGHIAPNETFALKNVNGGGAYMTHPTISFASNQAWSVTFCVNWFATASSVNALIGNAVSGQCVVFLNTNGTISFRPKSGGSAVTTTKSILNYSGKNAIITFSATTGSISIYINGVFFETISISIDFELIRFMAGSSVLNFEFNGQFHTHQINSAALTATQAQSLHNTIRGFIPEIPTVVIGSQTWATSNLEQVANSAGTLITDGTVTATWATNAAAYWCHHTDAATGAIYGKLYNSQAKAVINAGAPSGYRVATKADWTTLITAGGNALKIGGTTYWLNDLGTNSTGFSAIGGGSRAANGTFSTIKATAQFWCGDTNEVLVLNSADNTATFITAETGAGYSIRLIKI